MKSLVVLTVLSLISVNAHAKNGYFKKFKATYPESKIIESSCLICHSNNDDYELNLYGQDYNNNDLNFKAIEGFDSDVDGFTNLDEIMAGTLPADKESHPEIQLPLPSPTEPLPPTIPPTENIPPIPPTE